MSEAKETKTEAEQKNAAQFSLQKIYIRDLSFESPAPAEYFLKKNFMPEINLQLNAESSKLSDDVYEVVLNITLTAKDKEADKICYLVELKQAGIFTLANFPRKDLEAMVNSYCVNILFPYAREAISSIIEKGGFPQLLLAPINFDALYQQHMERVKQSMQPSSEARH